VSVCWTGEVSPVRFYRIVSKPWHQCMETELRWTRRMASYVVQSTEQPTSVAFFHLSRASPLTQCYLNTSGLAQVGTSSTRVISELWLQRVGHYACCVRPMLATRERCPLHFFVGGTNKHKHTITLHYPLEVRYLFVTQTIVNILYINRTVDMTCLRT